MSAAKVYFADYHAPVGHSLLEKFRKLLLRAGIREIDFQNKYVAIKIHFGEEGNLAYLRPEYARVLVELIRELGGKPFLTDANTLYVGSRKNALDHLDLAHRHGFHPFGVGCQVLIADGLKGTDEVYVPVAGGQYVREAKIGRAIMDADIFISLNHFKGHESTGFGGAIKNIGMGSGSRAGKMEMHAAGKPQVGKSACTGCRACVRVCAHGAITFDAAGKAQIDHGRCVGCGRCLGVCNDDAIRQGNANSNEILCKRMAEYAKAVLDGRPHFHINMVQDVSPYCDCHGANDIPIIPDVGMFASFDPVALDQASADAANRQPPMAGSIIQGADHREDRFTSAHSSTHWQDTLAHAQQLGLGTREYELVTMK